jgi:hypothetical protein
MRPGVATVANSPNVERYDRSIAQTQPQSAWAGGVVLES